MFGCKTIGFFFLKISKEVGKAWRKINTREPHTPFSASFQTFCVTAHAYLNTPKSADGQFWSLHKHVCASFTRFRGLRFRDLGASFSSFGCFVFEIWVLRFRVLGASCFGLRFRVLRFRNYPTTHPLSWDRHRFLILNLFRWSHRKRFLRWFIDAPYIQRNRLKVAGIFTHSFSGLLWCIPHSASSYASAFYACLMSS